MASRRQLIIEALADRLRQITVQNGFQTDAGQAVYFGEVVELTEEDPDAVVSIVVGDAQAAGPATGPRSKNSYRLPISIQAVVRADLRNPLLTIESMVADCEQAIELPDRTLGGLINANGEIGLEPEGVFTIPREPGSMTVGTAVNYSALYTRSWGQP